MKLKLLLTKLWKVNYQAGSDAEDICQQGPAGGGGPGGVQVEDPDDELWDLKTTGGRKGILGPLLFAKRF